MFRNDYILFNSSITGKDAIHAVNINSGERFLALTGGFGFFNATVNGNQVLVENYIPNEYRLCRWDINEHDFKPLNERMINKDFYITPVVNRSGYGDIFSGFSKDTVRKPQKYYHLLNGLRFHSWSPVTTNNSYGAQVFADDALQQYSFSAMLMYNVNAKNGYGKVTANYSGFYPVFSLSAGTGFMSNIFRNAEDSLEFYSWQENSLAGRISIPVNLSRGAFFQNLEISAEYQSIFQRNIENIHLEDFDFGNGRFNTGGVSLSYLGYKQMSVRDFYPKFGALFRTGYEQTLTKSDYHGELFSFVFTGFLPGFFAHHSFRPGFAYEWQNPLLKYRGSYVFPGYMLYYRGYESVFYKELIKLSADYAFPFLLPRPCTGVGTLYKKNEGQCFCRFGKRRVRYFYQKLSFLRGRHPVRLQLLPFVKHH
ncbi:MAG: hypothetical protein HC906_09710 [Bacteroidales bacterium]|nr:hypothetical protein [Bacteroidales bacterium]